MQHTSIKAGELARKIGRHKNTVLAWAKQGSIPCVRRNTRVILFVEADVRAAMAANGLTATK